MALTENNNTQYTLFTRELSSHFMTGKQGEGCEDMFLITLPRRRSTAMSQRVDAAFTFVARMCDVFPHVFLAKVVLFPCKIFRIAR